MSTPEPPTVYLVVEPGYDGVTVDRAYLDKTEAQTFVDAYNNTRGALLEIEEHPLGAPKVEYDGPVYEAHWSTRRKLRGETQLILASEDGFTMIIPSAVPTSGGYRYTEYFGGGPTLVAPDYEEPPVWIDHFYDYTTWRTGDRPAEAESVVQEPTRIVVHGTSKDAADELVRRLALEAKETL